MDASAPADALLTQFSAQANLLAADVVTGTMDGLSTTIRSRLASVPPDRLACTRELVAALPQLSQFALSGTQDPLAVASLGRLMVASTGSVLLAEATREDRALRCSIPIHFILVAAGNIVPSLQEAAEPIRREFRSGRCYLTMVSGPSRTADIEKVLTIGAHGPRALTIVVILDWAPDFD